MVHLNTKSLNYKCNFVIVILNCYFQDVFCTNVLVEAVHFCRFGVGIVEMSVGASACLDHKVCTRCMLHVGRLVLIHMDIWLYSVLRTNSRPLKILNSATTKNYVFFYGAGIRFVISTPPYGITFHCNYSSKLFLACLWHSSKSHHKTFTWPSTFHRLLFAFIILDVKRLFQCKKLMLTNWPQSNSHLQQVHGTLGGCSYLADTVILLGLGNTSSLTTQYQTPEPCCGLMPGL